MGTKINPESAIATMRAADLEPIEPYVHSKKPWRCIHKKCGREVSPTYNAIQRGQGGCGYCSGVKLDPSEAEAFLRSKGFEPLETYPGNKTLWKVRHVECGKETKLKYNVLQQGYTQGCRFCSKVIVDAEEAFRFFQSKGLTPLVEYPGANVPWKSIHQVCGNVISPRYGHIKSGRTGCPHCSNNLPISQEKAFELFRANGLEPLEKFSGPHVPWISIHNACGRKVSPRYASLQQGAGPCKYCSGNAVDEKDALALLAINKLKPLVDFPGSKMPWLCVHETCGKEVSPTHNALQRGQGGCIYCSGRYVDPEEARTEIEKLGFQPLEEYSPQKSWKVIHRVCGNEIQINYSYTKRTGKGCILCSGLKPVTQQEVKDLFETQGFTMLEKFINTRTPVKAIHNVCKREVSPSYGSLKNGGGCKFCQVGGINLLKPGFIYVMTNEELSAVKIGIGSASTRTNRIEQHKRHGWQLYKKLNLETAEVAYEIEQEVISWLRGDLSLPMYLSIKEMPQGGHTETVSALEIDSWTIWQEVIRLVEMRKIEAKTF
jgi:hypothetical protein